jgi:Na+/H+ antiporter NhaD/arsenite permease-like protein
MIGLLVLVFLVGYLAIIFEHKISIDKSSSALLVGTLCWTLVSLISTNMQETTEKLMHQVGEIGGILFFLMGAMTIVELIDTYRGFDLITSKITTRNQVKLLWIVCMITFFLSASLDNLTTAIVMVSLIKKLVNEQKTKLLFVGMIVLSANAGGAWSPMGDVTTTMLWIGGNVSAGGIVLSLFLPSLVSLLLPLVILSFSLKGELSLVDIPIQVEESKREKNIIFWTGFIGLISVPIFKTVTHLPPFIGMLLALGVIWTVAELLLKNKDENYRSKFSVIKVLEKVDIPSILFFLGILLAVSALETVGVLSNAANWLTSTIKNETLTVTLMGLLSSVIDNVPLVAATMGMFSLEQYPMNHPFWELLAFCAGTGGSTLIIGSAAGVAAMGIQKIEFFWYVKKISWLALIGYFAGIGVFLLQKILFE